MTSIKKALESVSPAVSKAMELSDQALTKAGVSHVLVGGMAVNAHGYAYSTADVDYLVEESEAFDGGAVKFHKPGVPFEVNGVKIDLVTIRDDYPEVVKQAMRSALDEARSANEPVIASDGLLVWMKLNAGRPKDFVAVQGLLSEGCVDLHDVLDFLALIGDERVLKRYERCLDEVEKNG